MPLLLYLESLGVPPDVALHDIRRAQKNDPFARQMVRRCGRARASDRRSLKFAVSDGVLFRATFAADPEEGIDAMRAYVPPELRSRLMFNYHNKYRQMQQTFASRMSMQEHQPGLGMSFKHSKLPHRCHC